jgi:hypothetical protein
VPGYLMGDWLLLLLSEHKGDVLLSNVTLHVVGVAVGRSEFALPALMALDGH